MHKTSHRYGSVVINPKGEIALVNEHLGKNWSFPKGGGEPGETPLDSAKREVFEETGISQYTEITELGTYQRYPGNLDENTPGAYPMTIHMFLFRTDEIGNLNPTHQEKTEAKWFTLEEALVSLSFEKDREFLQKIKAIL